MEVSDTLCPTHNSKTLGTMNAPCAVKRIIFDRSEGSPRAGACADRHQLGQAQLPDLRDLRLSVQPHGNQFQSVQF